MLRCGLVAVSLACAETPAAAVELIYPDENLLVGGQTFTELLQTRSTGVWTWPDYPNFNNGQPVYSFERRQGRTFVPQEVPADTFILGLRIGNGNFAGANESPCLNDRDYPFLEMTIDELDDRMVDPDRRFWFDRELVEDFDWDAARFETEGHILYPPHTSGTCIDPEDTASGDPIPREMAWAGHYFLIPPLDPGVYDFEYYTDSGTFITREFTVVDGLIGDLDRSGQLDAADIDMISASVRDGSRDLLADRDRNGIVNSDDRSQWVHSFTYFGDANLDGEFNSDDFVMIFEAGEYEDGVSGNSGWATGDWNGDAEFTNDDIVTAFIDGGYNQGPRTFAHAVPEPTGLAMMTTFLMLAAVTIRRRSYRGRIHECRLVLDKHFRRKD